MLNYKKKEKIIFLVILLLFLVITIFTFNNDFLYKKKIMKISNIKEIKEEVVVNSIGIHEKIYTKQISGTITNGKDKGKKITLEYEDTFSNVITEKYKKGDKVFISSNSIVGLKRDCYLIIMVEIFILLLLILGKKRGILTLFTVAVNTIIFYFGIDLYLKGINLLLMCIIISILTTVFSLTIVNGRNKKTLSAVISTLVSLLVLLIIIIITCKLSKYSGINFTEINFLTVPYEDVFIAEILIGGLGAIMDVAMTIVSAISEIIEKNPNVSTESLKKSGKAISTDIMGTMINVLLFTYLCSGLDKFVLASRNGFSITNYITSNLTIEETRFLVGSIGIVLTIPISLYITIKMFRKGKV